MRKASRHIPKKVDEKVREASGFKCAWCGIHITERHHIEPFYLVQEHKEDNLILLCPTCHTEAGSGKISESELKERRISISGEIDRSSGSLSVPQKALQIDVGGNHFVNCKNILMFNDNPLISVENDNGYLLVSLKFFDEKGNLVCWMSKNRWWVEGSLVKNFKHTKNQLLILDNQNEPILRLDIKDNLIEVQGYMFIKGNRISFSKSSINFGSGGQFIGNLFSGPNAIVFSDDPSVAVGACVKINI